MNINQFAGLALLAFGATELLLRRGSAAKSLKTTAVDKATTPLILACYGLVVALFFLPHLPGRVFSDVVRWVAVGAAFAGLGLRWWAMLILGQFYTRTLVTTVDQSVITRGPYRFIRHPGYLGSLLTWAGAAAAQGHVLLLILVFVVLAIAYAWRISAEEAMLVGALGPAYSDYQRRTWRLLPLIF